MPSGASMARAVAGVAAVTLVSFGAPALGAASLGPASFATAAASTAPVAGSSIPAPGHRGTLRISGVLTDGSTVSAVGLSWSKPRLPRGMTLLSFEVAYAWQSCAPGGKDCRTG